MRTLKKVLEGAAPQKDTKRFVDKHVVTKHPDANGNGDDVFNGTTKPVDREKERHGYSGKTDHTVYERALTDAEMSKREDVVKGMKKNLSSFKERYGKDAKSVMYATATKMAKEETEVESEAINEGEESHAQFQKYHNDSAAVLKKITGALAAHYDNVTDKKSYMGGQAQWHHVDAIKNIHRSLQDLHDHVLREVDYNKPPEVKKTAIREETNLIEEGIAADLVELHDLLSEEQQQELSTLLEEEKFEEVLSFIEALGDE